MDEKPIHKLTEETASDQFLRVLDRLRGGEEVPLSEIENIPEILYANISLSSSTPTIEIKGREIIQENVYNRLQKMGSAVTKSDGTVSLTGEVRCDRRLDIIIGLPAAGKSSAIAEPISELFKSRIIDCDEAKKMLPGFDNGWGTGAVHKESQKISNRQRDTALEKGENIAYPRIGGNAEEMVDIIKTAKTYGYKVYVHYNELERNKALGRMLERFLNTGRYIKPDLITNHGDTIGDTYRQLKKSGIIDGFTKWNNDVPFGERPIAVEHSTSCNDVYEALREKREPVKTETHDHDDTLSMLNDKVNALQAELNKVKAERDIFLEKLEEVSRVFKQLPPEFTKKYVQKRSELRGLSPPTRNDGTRRDPPKPKNPKH